MRDIDRKFLYHCFSGDSPKTNVLYDKLIKEPESELKPKFDLKKYHKLYDMFGEIIINKDTVKKIKEKLYSISFKDISDLIDKGQEFYLKEFNISYDEKEGKWHVPAEIILLGALNDLLGPFDRITPYSKKEILGWTLGEKRRDRTLAGLNFLGCAFLLATYPVLYNFSNYMYGIPALFYWSNLSNLVSMTISNIYLEENLRKGYWRLNSCRRDIVYEMFNIYKKQEITPEKISLENILKGVEKRKQEVLKKMIDDRAGNKEEGVRGILDWEHFLSKFYTGSSIANAGISLAVLAASPVFRLPVLGPGLAIGSTALSACNTHLHYKNAVIYGKGKKTFKEKINKMEPEQAIWEILTFLNTYKERKILGNKLSVLNIVFGELLGIFTLIANPSTIADIGIIGFLIANLFNFYNPIAANRSLKKEKERINKLVELKEKVKILY